MLAGIESLDYGSSTAMKGLSFGYLPQDGLTLSGRTVFAECMTVFASLRQIEEELEDTVHTEWRIWIRSAPNTTPLQIASIASTASFERATATRSRRRSERVLDGLGFPKEDWTRRTEEFSGGWQMRIALG